MFGTCNNQDRATLTSVSGAGNDIHISIVAPLGAEQYIRMSIVYRPSCCRESKDGSQLVCNFSGWGVLQGIELWRVLLWVEGSAPGTDSRDLASV